MVDVQCFFRRAMEGLDISELRVEPCVDSRYIKPSRVVFKQVSHFNLFSTILKDLCRTRHTYANSQGKLNLTSGVDLYALCRYPMFFRLAHSLPNFCDNSFYECDSG